MADVKWIKITTDIFDDEKILLIESLPDSYAIITCWFKLLCLAGKMNNSGVFMMSNRIAYTDKMLATIFRMKESIVTMAMNTFEQFGMIEIVDGVITIPNWGKHQSIDQIEAKKEYMRSYMAEYRQKQKAIADGNNSIKSNSKTNSKSNVSSIDKIRLDKIREDKMIEGEYIQAPDSPSPSAKSKKHKFGEFEKVLLSDEEYEKLCNDFGKDETEKAIAFFDAYIAEKGYKSKSHYLAMRRWVFDAVKDRKPKNQQKSSNPFLDLLEDGDYE